MVEVLYSDNHLLVLDKPGGLLTQPSGTDELSLEAQGKEFLGKKFLEAVHRLDRLACGIVVFARTSKALRRMMKTIREGKFQKFYRVRVEGTLPSSGELEHFLLREEHYTRVVPEGTPGAKRALLRFCGDEIELITGRTHQIRAQLAAIGSPIVGDRKYGASSSAPAISLLHARCSFPHPIGGDQCTISSKMTI